MQEQNKNSDLNTQDYLQETMESFFRFVKQHQDKLQPEYIRDAINGALSGLDYGFNREDYLCKLIEGSGLISQVAEKELQLRELNRNFWDGAEYSREIVKNVKQEAMTLDDVVKNFGLALNNVKNKKWRDDNSFPYKQPVAGGKVTYYRSAVQKWVDEH